MAPLGKAGAEARAAGRGGAVGGLVTAGEGARGTATGGTGPKARGLTTMVNSATRVGACRGAAEWPESTGWPSKGQKVFQGEK